MDGVADIQPKLPTLSEWRSYFRSRGIRPDLLPQYLDYIRPLVERGVPVIFDFRHLCELLGRTPDFLARASTAPEHFYRSFKIPKKSGGYRTISAPYPSLKECQQWIATQIVTRRPIHPTATAYRANSSIVGNVTPHLATGTQVLVIDIKDFFPSITKKRLIGWFAALGYNYEVAISLASLCCLGGHLPQGSPASPHLSNAICTTLDRRLERLADHFSIRYTRYADDMCFSGEHIPSGVFNLIANAIAQSGFVLNPAKTRSHGPAATSKIVTGINIATGSPRLPRKRRRQLSHTLHFIEEFGYLSHRAKLKITDPKYLLRLRGQLEYWRMIEPANERVLRFIAQVSQLQRVHGDG